MQVQSLGQEDPLEEGMATHSSILAWRISWMEDPGGLQSIGLKSSDTTEVTQHVRVCTNTHTHTHTHTQAHCNPLTFSYQATADSVLNCMSDYSCKAQARINFGNKNLSEERNQRRNGRICNPESERYELSLAIQGYLLSHQLRNIYASCCGEG